MFRAGSLYLTSRTSGHCLLKGEVRSARILERANIELIVKQKDTLLCTGNCIFLLILLLRTIWFCYLKGGRAGSFLFSSVVWSVGLSVGRLVVLFSSPNFVCSISFHPFAWKLPKLSVVVAFKIEWPLYISMLRGQRPRFKAQMLSAQYGYIAQWLPIERWMTLKNI